ncbi:AAA family ATPase [Sphingobacterium multivorum]|uniref:AAA family ATPase n=1 Tax=Sphingobacterium multivorum TaxID=28454 RepID=A0ABX7CTA1_SPHMU|nr:AAA family ATPase [Sphingobacterium multivorum]QQT55339.1 AAA family ATPase [Sphingobacterium multivorum]
MNIKFLHNEVFNHLYKHYQEDEDFRFTLRQINRDSKLEKGFWFLGSEEYLSLSFWSGTDWKTQSPIIAFVVFKDGTSKVEINDKEHVLKNLGIREEICYALGLDESTIEYVKSDRLRYSDDYITSLAEFIRYEKPKVDQVLLSISTVQNSKNRLDFIEKKYFQKSLNRILDYQKQNILEHKVGVVDVKISSMAYTNPIEIKNIPEDCQWIFITGENGSGKTNLLRLLAAGICLNKNEENAFLIKEDFDTVVVLKNGTEKIENQVFYKGMKHISSVNALNENSKQIAFCSYGPVRLFSESTLLKSFNIENTEKIAKSRTFGLFNSFNILQDFSSKNIFTRNEKGKSITIYEQSFLENLVANLIDIIPSIGKIDLIENDGIYQLLYYQKTQNGEALLDKPVTFDKLSSGTRNLVGFILDLLIKLETQNKNVDDIANYTGIVIIDEIDLHLHPRMQKEIVVQLSKTFPKLQFIVTTHSPISLLGAPKNSIFLRTYIDDNDKTSCETLNIEVANLLPNTLLTSPVFGFQDLIPVDNELKSLETSEHYNEAVFKQILIKKLNERLEDSKNL